MLDTPGKSGHPAERLSATRGKALRTSTAALQARGNPMVDALVRRALGGHPASLRACARWRIVVGRGRPLPMTLGPIASVADARAAVARLDEALKADKLTVRETAQLLFAVERFRPNAPGIALVKEFARIEGTLAKAAAEIGIDYMFTRSEGPAAARARRVAAARARARQAHDPGPK